MANAHPEADGGSFIGDQEVGRYTVVSVNPRRLLLGMLPALGLAAALAPITASAVNVSPLNCAGPNACDILNVYTTIFWVAMVVLVIVGGLIVFAALRFRRRDDREPSQIHGNTRLELVWTAVPLLIVSFLFLRTTLRMDYVRNGPPPAQVIRVTGIQWAWQFKYPNGKTSNTKLYIPVGQVVQLQVTSRDVLHSFWVPRLGGQVYAIPGQMNHGWIQADQTGNYFGQCNELCGLYHYAMDLQVVAVSNADYNGFLAGTLTPGVGPALAEKVTGASAAANVKETDELKFDPLSASVKVGEVVEWTNVGTQIHDITFDNGAVPTSDNQNGGDKYELKFLKPGTYHYICSIHKAANMNGTITVTGG
ncbi:MAG: cytochrome c oxidase subunit II [Chloroflexi bacterium]|nr:MAG: cytochrome c oxidase subunit II [Chloroflexota bacterium]